LRTFSSFRHQPTALARFSPATCMSEWPSKIVGKPKIRTQAKKRQHKKCIQGQVGFPGELEDLFKVPDFTACWNSSLLGAALPVAG
jgi:hypothetical protein